MANWKQRRRNLLIDSFQWRILGVYLIHFGVIVVVVLGALYAPLLMRLENSSLSAMQRLEVTNQILGLTQQLVPASWLIFGLLAIHSAIVSHRIAGPIYRIRRILKAASEGDFSNRLNLRKHDYLLREADAVNVLMESLNASKSEVEEKHAGVDAALRSLKATMSDAPNDTRQKLETLEEEIEAWESTLHRAGSTTEARDVEKTSGRDRTTVSV